jgi:hypothetical protein
MEEVVALSLQSNAPVETVDKVEVLLQLPAAVTTGLAGAVLGLATIVFAGLTQPLTVWVTL